MNLVDYSRNIFLIQYVLTLLQTVFWFAIIILTMKYNNKHASFSTTFAVAIIYFIMDFLFLIQPFAPDEAQYSLRTLRVFSNIGLGFVTMCLVLWAASTIIGFKEPVDFLKRIYYGIHDRETE